jgi:recombination protein RecA
MIPLPRVQPLRSLIPQPSSAASPAWSLSRLSGRVTELSGFGASARLTVAVGLVVEAQRRGELPAWITLRGSTFFPPDVAESGVDLEALAVVKVADGRSALRGVDQLLRSGGFGLIVLDLDRAGGDDRLPTPSLTRVVGLAKKHDTPVLILTDKAPGVPSISSLVSVRADARRTRRNGGWEVRVSILKDKRSGPGGKHVEVCRGPAGLR